MFHPDQAPSISGNPGALYPPALPAPVQARKGVGQIRNLFQFAMLFEKSKEKSKIRTWYHKSFLSTSRLSELGRRDSQEKLGQRRGMRYVRSGQRGIVPHTHQSRAELRTTTTTARDAIRQLTDQASIRLVSGYLSQSPLPPKTVRSMLPYP